MHFTNYKTLVSIPYQLQIHRTLQELSAIFNSLFMWNFVKNFAEIQIGRFPGTTFIQQVSSLLPLLWMGTTFAIFYHQKHLILEVTGYTNQLEE